MGELGDMGDMGDTDDMGLTLVHLGSLKILFVRMDFLGLTQEHLSLLDLLGFT